jgi:hypothetical protein
MQLKIILGRDFIPNFKRFSKPMPKNKLFSLVYVMNFVIYSDHSNENYKIRDDCANIKLF